MPDTPRGSAARYERLARRIALVQYGGGVIALAGVVLMVAVSIWAGLAPLLVGCFLIDWPLFWKVTRD